MLDVPHGESIKFSAVDVLIELQPLLNRLIDRGYKLHAMKAFDKVILDFLLHR